MTILLIFCWWKVHRGYTRSLHNTIKIRSIKKYSVESLLTLLITSKWSSVFESKKKCAWTHFINSFTSVMNKITLIKQFVSNKRTQLWMNDEILELIRYENHNIIILKVNHPAIFHFRSTNKICNQALYPWCTFKSLSYS